MIGSTIKKSFQAVVMRLGIASLLLATFALSAAGVSLAAGNCMEDVVQAYDGTNAVPLNCTANDVRVQKYNVLAGPSFCLAGEPVTLRLQAELVAGAGERYDIGLFTALDGGNALRGTCQHEYLYPPLEGYPTYNPTSGTGPYLNAELTEDLTDTCGDLAQGVVTKLNLPPATFICEDANGDGWMDLANCISWDNMKSAGTLSKPSCDEKTETRPNTKSKCRCETAQTVNVQVRGQIIIDKVTYDHLGVPLPGDPTSFAFLLTGTGTSTSFSLTDAATPYASAPLAAGTYAVTETVPADWSLASATCSDGSAPGAISLQPGETVTCTFRNWLMFVPAPAIDLNKQYVASNDGGNGRIDTGDSIDYSFTVQNIGNVALSSVYVSDPLIGTVSCPQSTLAADPDGEAPFVGEVMTCTGSYAVSQQDLNNGSILNTATAYGTDPDGTTVNDIDAETVGLTQTPALSLDKTATPSTYDSVGDTISYSYLVTNTGNVTLSGPVTVADNKATVTCPAGGLAPGASLTCTASYTITQADLDGGSVTNTATASANGTDSNQDSETVTAVQTPALSLNKTATPSTYDSVGDTISYSYLVTNTGNVTLSGPVTVADNKAAVTCTPAVPTTLAPQGTIACTASYAVTQADLDSGAVTNLATATGSFGGSNYTATDSETVTAAQTPALSLDKTADPATYSAVGQSIDYSYQLTNSGNVTLSGPFTVTDDKATVTCPATASLAVGASVTCSASYTITQADLDGGSVTNLATGAASFNGQAVTSNQDSATVTAVANPALTVAKSVTESSYSAAGDLLHYSYLITNTGNVTLSNVTLSDDKAAVTCTPAVPTTLAPQGTIACTASYAVTQADLDSGAVTNLATATGSFGGSNYTATDSETVTAAQTPALSLDKTADPATYSAVGQSIDYSYQLTNSGNVTLSGPFTVTDDKATVTCPATASLAVGASVTCSASYTITQADLDGGSVTNTATGHGYFGTTPVASDPDSETVNATQTPAIDIQKTPDSQIVVAGNPATFTILVTNTGNVTLSNVTISDPLATACNASIASLAPGATYQKICSTTAAADFTNIATVTATGPQGQTVSDSDDAFVNVLPPYQASISVYGLNFNLMDTDRDKSADKASGTFIIQDASGEARVTEIGIRTLGMTIEYRTGKDKTWQTVSGKTCTFDPPAGTVFGVTQPLTVNFVCQDFAPEIPQKSTVRLTAEVSIYNRDRVFTYSKTLNY